MINVAIKLANCMHVSRSYIYCILFLKRSLFMYITLFFIVFYIVFIGFIDLSSESEDLNLGTKLELPLWLAQPLNKTRTPYVSVDTPKTYKEGYRCKCVCICIVKLITIRIRMNFLTVCFWYILQGNFISRRLYSWTE